MPRAKKAVPAPVAAVPAEQPAPIVPAGPSPAVLELQSDIVSLVRERSGYRKRVVEIQTALFKAQADFQATQAGLNQYEQEIAERIALIAQLENRAPQTRVSEAADYPGITMFPGSLAGVSSEPTPQQVRDRMGQSDDMINRAHIDRGQAAAMRSVL